MLCPQCGNEVGDKIKLCDDCQAKRQARLAAERGAEPEKKPPSQEQTPSNTEDSASEAAQNDAVVQEEKSSNKKHAVILLVLLVCALVGVKALKRMRRQTPTETAPITAPTEKATPTPVPEFQYVGSVKGGLRYGKDEVRLGSVIAAYSKRNRKLELAFFRKWDQKLDPKAIRRKEALENIQGVVPDAVLSVIFKPDLAQCSLQGVEEYRLRIYRNENSLGLPSPVTSFPVKEVAGSLGQGIGTALESLGCSFVDREKVNGNFRGSKQIVVLDETKNLSWDLDFEVPLVGPGDGREVDYQSESSKTTLALWNSSKGSLDIAFYGENLKPQEKEDIRVAASPIALEAHRPDLVFSLGLSPGAKQIRREDVKTFGVTFYKGGAEGIEFPGVDKQVGLFYAGNSHNGGLLENLSGDLKDGSVVSGSYEQTAMKKVAGNDVAFSWALAFHTSVLDTAVRGTALTASSSEPPSGDVANLETQAKIAADTSQVRIRSTVSLFYPQGNSLSIGFYADALSEGEIEEVIKRKTLTTYINRKRPVMVAILEFDEGEKPTTPLKLRTSTLYFYREVGGTLQFPGFHDVVSIKHGAEQLPSGEVIQIFGDPRARKALRLVLKGHGSPSTISTLFTWDIVQDIVPSVLD